MLGDRVDRLTFGLFEADMQTGELWKGGFRIKLPRQPFRVLTLLLLHSGEVVTREELQRELWGANTNVDFDQAIAASINKIREALGDSAENPRFIQTLTKRGYRFIAPVSPVRTPVTHFEGEAPRGGAESLSPSPVELLVPEQQTADQVGVDAFPATPVKANAALQRPFPLPLPELPPTSGTELTVSTGSARTRDWPFRSLWLYLATACVCLVVGAMSGRWLRPSVAKTQLSRIDQVTHHVPISLGPPNPESFLAMAMDGDRVLTSVLVDGVPRLSAIDLNSGDVRELDVPDEIAANSLVSISRDGSRLLLRAQQSAESEQPLWIVPSAGGSGRRLPGILAHDAVWMPDGVTVLYANGNTLFAIGANEDSPQEYLKLPGRAFWLRWSPDGKVLRFTLFDPVTHTTSLWELEAASRALQQVRVPGMAQTRTCCGIWLPDGKSFVFQNDDELYLLKGSAQDATLTQLTNGPLRSMSPLASQSDNRIYFVGLEAPSGLEQFDLSLKTYRPAPAFLANANRLDYSSDGKWVAWADIYQKLWRARVDGTDRIRLTPDTLEVFMAHWAPNGKQLAVMARRPGGVWQTYLVDANGGKVEALLGESRNAADPGWSQDGRHLVFGREPELMGKEDGPHDLRMVDIATRQVEKVPGSDALFSPRWSPDGRWILALTLDQKSIRLYDVERHQWHNLASITASDPVWSADSKAIYIHAFRSDGDPVLRIGVPEGEVKVLANLRSLGDSGATNYFFGGVTPHGEPLVQPRIGTGDLYALDVGK